MQVVVTIVEWSGSIGGPVAGSTIGVYSAPPGMDADDVGLHLQEQGFQYEGSNITAVLNKVRKSGSPLDSSSRPTQEE